MKSSALKDKETKASKQIQQKWSNDEKEEPKTRMITQRIDSKTNKLTSSIDKKQFNNQ